MDGKPLAGCFDSLYNAACEIALLESLSQGARDPMPELLAHLLVDASVG